MGILYVAQFSYGTRSRAFNIQRTPLHILTILQFWKNGKKKAKSADKLMGAQQASFIGIFSTFQKTKYRSHVLGRVMVFFR